MGGGTMSTMVSVFDVAQYILQTIGAPISTMKLQKLVYYCQAWHLAWENVPLFNEDFEAWANGPVCRELYSLHRGIFLLSKKDFENILKENKKTISSLPKKAQETVDLVIKFYGEKEPAWLSACTHAERPWKEARGDTPLGQVSTNIISKDSMLEYYSELSVKSNDKKTVC